MKKFIVGLLMAIAASSSMAQVSIVVEKNAVTFTNTTVDSVKAALLERLIVKEFVVEDRGSSMTASKNALGNVPSFAFLLLAYSFGGGSDSTIEITSIYNFSRVGNDVRVTPVAVVKHTSRFGQTQQRAEPQFISEIIKSLQTLEVR